MKTITVSDEHYDLLKQLSDIRKTQSNDGTRDPIWSVQSRYSRSCNTEYENVDEYIFVLDCEEFLTIESKLSLNEIKEELQKSLEETFEEFDDPLIYTKAKKGVVSFEEANTLDEVVEWLQTFCDDSIYLFEGHYEYRDKAYFLSKECAQEYIKSQSHNLCAPRTYCHNIGYANYGLFSKLLTMLENIDLK